DVALVSDEVFAASALGEGAPPSALAGAEAGPLHVALSGASKRLGLPQLKVAWLVVAGPPAVRDEALARLEFLVDAYLSVSPLLSAALPVLLAHRPTICDSLRLTVAAIRVAHAAASSDTHSSPALIPLQSK